MKLSDFIKKDIVEFIDTNKTYSLNIKENVYKCWDDINNKDLIEINLYNFFIDSWEGHILLFYLNWHPYYNSKYYFVEKIKNIYIFKIKDKDFNTIFVSDWTPDPILTLAQLIIYIREN